MRKFDTVNGVAGNGGAIDSSPYVAANGTLFVVSGYSVLASRLATYFSPLGRSALEVIGPCFSSRSSQSSRSTAGRDRHISTSISPLIT